MKIHCIFHKDKTASLEIYANGRYKCFGCGAHGYRRELEGIAGSPKVKENLAAAIDRILALPEALIRGHMLPHDDKYYYVVYPTEDYYIARRKDDDSPSRKYLSPTGHPKPIYECFNQGSGLLFFIEGQLNALSFSNVALGEHTIASPGASTDFNKVKSVNYCLRYPLICLIVDRDIAGVEAGLELKETLLKNKKRVVLFPLKKPDLNALYVENKEKVKEVYNSCMELLRAELQRSTVLPTPRSRVK